MSGGFEDLGLLPELVKATQELGWLLPSDVQDEAIPLILGGGDVMVAAETGSGKTGAFALPAIQIVHETRRAIAEAAVAGPSSAATPAKRPRTDEDAAVKLNQEDRSPLVAIAPDGLTCQCRAEKAWGGVRANRGVKRGKVYYEARIRDDGLCRFGWSTIAASLELGTDRSGFGYGGTGKRSNDNKFEDFGEKFGNGDVIGCCIDMGDGAGSGVAIGWTKNGKPLQPWPCFAVPGKGSAGPFYPAICMKNAELAVTFGGPGSAPFVHSPPEGYVGIGAAPEEWLVTAAPAVAAAGAGSGGKGKGGKPGDAVGPVCLVLSPGRDLAEQTHKAFDTFRTYMPGISNALIIGGVDRKETSREVGQVPDIVNATPGKLLDLVESNKLNLSQVRLLILDEADNFASNKESMEDITKLYNKIRGLIDSAAAPGRLQVCFFSATLHSPEITDLSAKMANNPTWVDLKGKDSVPETVHHVMISVDPNADRSWLPNHAEKGDPSFNVPTDELHDKPGNIGARPLSADEYSEGIKRLKPRLLLSLVESLQMDQCLIFVRTNVDCNNLEQYLTAVGGGQKFRAGREKGKENAYSCVVLAGMRSMEERRNALDAFKAGDVRFLICTDVGARGIDIRELPYVINMTLPDESEQYIHRVGRVGRADRMGLAISLVAADKERVWYHKCNNRGKGCHNTKLTTAGGCTIWYDEPALLTSIKKRLGPGHPIPLMSCTRNAPGPSGAPLPYLFALPPEIAAAGATYGEERAAKTETSHHVEAIKGAVASLAALEVKAQSAYHALRLRFSAPGASPAPASATSTGRPAAPAS